MLENHLKAGFIEERIGWRGWTVGKMSMQSISHQHKIFLQMDHQSAMENIIKINKINKNIIKINKKYHKNQ